MQHEMDFTPGLSAIIDADADWEDERVKFPETLQCIKTQERRNLKMKKHRRKKRKKLLYLKLKAQGKI